MQQQDLPPLPADFEPIFYETLEKVRGIAARIKEERSALLQQQQRASYSMEKPSQSGSSRITKEALVQANRAGLVIGNRGENLKRIERLAQVKIVFDQNFVSPTNEKRFTISGFPEDVEEGIKLIQEKAQEPDSRYPSIHLTVPSHKVGLVIGKGGETIRELQEMSGAKVTIAPDGGQDQLTGERPISIMGDQEAINRAKSMLDNLLTNGIRPSQATGVLSGAGRNTVTIQIPESCVGAIIGKKAETLKSFQAMSNAKVFVEPTLQPGQTKRSVHLSGSPECIAYAKQLIEEKVRQCEMSNSGMHASGVYDPSAMYNTGAAGGSGVVYQAPGEFAASMVDPSAAAGAAGGYDYAQYYQQYYQQYGQYYQQQYGQQPTDPNATFDYAAYAAQYAAAAAAAAQSPPPPNQ